MAFTETKSLRGVLVCVLARPARVFVRHWNWKSAAISSVLRAQIFFAVNIKAGWKAAVGAMAAEFLLQSLVAGFYGSLQQAFSAVEPAWHGAVASAFVVPILQHALELGLHRAVGTHYLRTSIIASVSFTVLATLFNWYAMRQNALTVGPGSQSIWSDLRRLPVLLQDLSPGAPFIRNVPMPLRFIGSSRKPHDIDNKSMDSGTGELSMAPEPIGRRD
jgi:hypothetical protein